MSATLLANLLARQEAIGEELEALNALAAGGRPDASGGAINVQHVAYRMSLHDELERIEKQLARLDGPVEAEHYGTV